jgi:hypothetical protein
MAKSQTKAKMGSFENEQSLVPKDMGNCLNATKQNTTNPHEEEEQAQHH